MSDDANVVLHPTATAVRKSITVNASQRRAFDVFTAGVDTWWPREHHIGDLPMKSIVIEPKAGGRCYSDQDDGQEFDWATVLVWEPPVRIVIGWHLNADWVCDPSFTTEVEVTFTALDDDRTEVVLEHRNLDRYGDRADELSAALGAEDGWTGSLKLFAAAAEGRGAATTQGA